MQFATFSAPKDQRYFEDYVQDAVYEFGSVSVTEQEIIDFAGKFDPQAFHLDPVQAAKGPFKGLIASGWHTTSLGCKLYVEHFLSSVASLGSPGVDELRWMRPVRPGDTLRLRITILESKPSSSKNDRGLIRSLLETINQHDEVVMSAKIMSLLLTRNPLR